VKAFLCRVYFLAANGRAFRGTLGWDEHILHKFSTNLKQLHYQTEFREHEIGKLPTPPVTLNVCSFGSAPSPLLLCFSFSATPHLKLLTKIALKQGYTEALSGHGRLVSKVQSLESPHSLIPLARDWCVKKNSPTLAIYIQGCYSVWQCSCT